MSQEAALNETAERLVRKLEEVRRQHAEKPEADRRAAFEHALEEELGRVPAADADRVIEEVRARLIRTARDRDQRVEQLEKLVREREATIAELRKTQSAAPAAPAPTQLAGPAPDLDKVRAALVQVVEGKVPDAAALGLSPSDESLYALIAALIRFTTGYGQSRTWILASLGVGAAANADSVMIKSMQDKAKKSMAACLQGDLSASETLQVELKAYAEFLIGLHESFQHSVDTGTRSVLGELAQQQLLEKHKRLVGFDYEAAWRELEGVHARLSDLSRGEIWEQHFLEPFRKKMGEKGSGQPR